MVGFKRGGLGMLAGIASLALLALAPGCDWLKGSEMIRRTSPFLSGLSVSAASVRCDQEFTVSFDYDDPQGDIFSVNIVLQHDGDSRTRDASTLWNESFSRRSGTAEYPVTFSCSDARGHWTISVSLEDDLAHTSNVLTGGVTLD
jgi:hypothetical protein